MKKPEFLIPALLAVTSCGGSTQQQKPVAGAPAAVAADTLGSLDGEPVKYDDLAPELRNDIAALENEAAQRRLHLLWVGLEDEMGKRLLAKEAGRRRMTVEALREQEVLAKVTPPTDQEIEQFYDQNADRIGVDFKTAAPHIRAQLATERARAVERALVEQLRERAQVRYSLPVPSLPRSQLDIGKGPSWGKSDAKVTIVEFSDFQCPYCARASAIIDKLKQLYPNDLRVEFRHFPLEQHPGARAAAEAAHCAFEQGKFWEYHDLLFANPRALAAADLEKYAAEAGLDTGAFAKCVASDRPSEAVETSLALGRKAAVQGTPALYINGMKLVGLLPLPLMQAFIDKELGRD